ANLGGAETSARPNIGASVEGHACERDVEAFGTLRQRQSHHRCDLTEAHPISRYVGLIVIFRHRDLSLGRTSGRRAMVADPGTFAMTYRRPGETRRWCLAAVGSAANVGTPSSSGLRRLPSRRHFLQIPGNVALGVGLHRRIGAWHVEAGIDA